ncbi:MAG: Bax inhibitor-1/YccA family protein [Nitrospinota bacterium]|nr:Bax inhibitor-1/YccA family protein [Nitrospinota bacterium]
MQDFRDLNRPRAKAAYAPSSSIAAEQSRFLIRVYNWMAAGLAVTAIVAWYVANTPSIYNAIIGNPILFFGIIIGELGLVFYLASRVMQMSAQRAMNVFIGYAALNGLTFSVIFVAYTQSSITTAFLVTGGMFAAMSFYGATTKKDLTSWGSFLFMGLIGIIIASLVNMFLQSPAVYWITTYAGVLIFTGLIAYDTQSILKMNIIGNEGTQEDTKEAISGALRLYLDFINLFIMLLRLLGERR